MRLGNHLLVVSAPRLQDDERTPAGQKLPIVYQIESADLPTPILVVALFL
jgi:hypothetical protein